MSNLSLQEIIGVMKTAALAAGFKKVSEKKINKNDTADTEVPKMHIIISKTEFGSISDRQFSTDTVLETYFFNLLIVTNNTEEPVSALKTLENDFLKEFLNASEMCDYNNQGKIQLVDSTATNNEEFYSVVGGESTILSLNIQNINTFKK